MLLFIKLSNHSIGYYWSHHCMLGLHVCTMVREKAIKGILPIAVET